MLVLMRNVWPLPPPPPFQIKYFFQSIKLHVMQCHAHQLKRYFAPMTLGLLSNRHHNQMCVLGLRSQSNPYYQYQVSSSNQLRPLHSIPLTILIGRSLRRFSSLRPFLIEGVLGSKNLFSESCLERPKIQGQTPFQTPSAILGPPGGHFGLAGGAALQAVSERPLRRQAGIIIQGSRTQKSRRKKGCQV